MGALALIALVVGLFLLLHGLRWILLLASKIVGFTIGIAIAIPLAILMFPFTLIKASIERKRLKLPRSR